MSSDIYKDASQIALMLKMLGQNNVAQEISDALLEGSTGTEIFLISRWKLKNIISQNNLNHQLKTEVEGLIFHLDLLLK